ncbi:MAG: beta family protein [Chthoniobacterales bacterium]
MIRYVPFLKAKRGERSAMGELAPEVKQVICPFFDFPRKEPVYNADTYVATTRSIATSLSKNWGVDAEFYFDDFDISQKLTVKGEHQYAYLLKAFDGLRVIPAVALNRTSHNAAVASLKSRGEISSGTVAFRAEHVDFEDFDGSEDQIDYDLATVFAEFEAIDLILDCRVCISMDILETARQIATFANKFCDAYDKVRRVIVTGSCIPRSLGEVVEPSVSKILPRRELAILGKARELTAINLVGGDYATVSPFYSDADFAPELFPRVTSPRLIYSFNRSHYISRGSSLASGGYGQYLGMTKQLCGQGFFRPGYSTGEDYFYEKSKGVGSRAMNNTVVKPSVVAHITYMALGASL